ncbi:unnamed protein product (macronuclear) [Paramecium tetraurelia]|uniref:DUF541 domain-containing protein n=1 Tax=Paramecium tetraurelia TaxID=5888 RepID=A0E087_PARTE|nr:uncharacterized protein GSPATT00021872001 [Paramecium tetraurelia]CAK88704.1 unnamed protein product [Paramecium tetraurelia]|eukprot:XP_001456101.1 hypothetical protein (macronuclear) [Paramecium tetraurelia strain d4-2]
MKAILVLSISLMMLNSQFIKTTPSIPCDSSIYLLPDIYYVKGSASTIVEPTQAVVTLEIEVKDLKAQVALQQAAQIADDAVKAIKENCQGGLKIQTADFAIQPHKEYSQNQPYAVIYSGFKVINKITVETLNTSDVGKIIDVAVKNKVNKVNGIQFDVSKDEKKRLKNFLVELAIEDAKHTANVVLKELKMRIESIKSVQLLENYGSETKTKMEQQVNVGFVIKPID